VKELRGDRRWLLRSLCHGTYPLSGFHRALSRSAAVM
jgi:hypothetical protein